MANSKSVGKTMKQVTMISLYKEKTFSLIEIIKSIQNIINSSIFAERYKAYKINQIHGTIVGLERNSNLPNFFNANMWIDLKRKTQMEFSELNDVVSKYLPMILQIGGFGKSFNEFKSFNKIPYERSFQINRKTGKAILIGWPHIEYDFSIRNLWNLRQEIEDRCNIRHKYAQWEDNDYFIVPGNLGGIKEGSEKFENELSAIEHDVRSILSANPVEVTLSYNNIFIAQYEDESLPLESTRIFPLNEVSINDKFIEELYICDSLSLSLVDKTNLIYSSLRKKTLEHAPQSL